MFINHNSTGITFCSSQKQKKRKREEEEEEKSTTTFFMCTILGLVAFWGTGDTKNLYGVG
jgi:hypothetical protein